MREAMANMLADFMKQLPRLLFQAGIMQLATPGGTALGLALIAASGISAFVGGAMRGATGAVGTEGPQTTFDTGGGATTIIVQGNVVTGNDLAWQQARLEQRW
jgi:hypothetical protein